MFLSLEPGGTSPCTLRATEAGRKRKTFGCHAASLIHCLVLMGLMAKDFGFLKLILLSIRPQNHIGWARGVAIPIPESRIHRASSDSCNGYVDVKVRFPRGFKKCFGRFPISWGKYAVIIPHWFQKVVSMSVLMIRFFQVSWCVGLPDHRYQLAERIQSDDEASFS